MFHTGGISWVSGRMAVFSFYSISGYLIFRVLDTSYMKDIRHVGYFYLNRFLRLMPLYAVVSILTYWFLVARGGSGFLIDPNDPPYNFITTPVLDVPRIKLIISEITFGIKCVLQPIPTISFFPNLIPQGWSIGIELCFYTIAPIMVFLCRKHILLIIPIFFVSLALFIYGIVISTDYSFVEKNVYKNSLASMFVFLSGGVMYFVSKRITWRLNFECLLLILAAWAYYVWFFSASPVLGAREPNGGILAINLFFTLPITCLVVFSNMPSRFRRYDNMIGNLSYGIYLNQFLVGYLLLFANEKVFNSFGEFQYFGRLNTERFGIAAVVLSVTLAAILYRYIESPVDRLRKKIKTTR